jgi:hypothetical protein
MIRDDLSTKLIHFTKGNLEQAIEKFTSIISEGRLKGGTGGIKGGHRCVCFTESPIGKFPYIFATTNGDKFPYAAFGVMVDKAWLFAQRGRPVIYQPDDEYQKLPDHMKWRHKSYDPVAGVDFTWEREWRINVGELPLDPKQTTIIVPKRQYEAELIGKHTNWQGIVSAEFGAPIAKPYPWHFICLEDLGVSFE